jgi:hypothetical protein
MTNSLPPWDDDQAMFDWVDRILNDEEITLYQSRNQSDDTNLRAKVAALVERDRDAADIEAAWKGDIEPLRKKYPRLAPFLALPPLRKRNAWHKAHQQEPTVADLIAFDVMRIRALWRKHYGRVNRKRGLITAAEIAARRYGLDPSALDKYEHPSGPKK